MKTAYFSHPDCAGHDVGGGHPESPRRLEAIERALYKSELMKRLTLHEAPPATREQIQRVHPAEHVDRIASYAPDSGLFAIDGDTTMNPHSLRAAFLAAGAAVRATELVLEGSVEHAFCGVRPPGHHAERNQAMGFCFFNNVAVGAAQALEHEDINKVAILDFDVHHGNGTEDIFDTDDRVLFCSTFQHPLYPYKGTEGDRSPLTINSPLPAGSGSTEFREAVQSHWLPALEEFAPDFIFISAGFDAHKADPLANLQLDEADFAWATQEIITQARKSAEGRIVSTLEGGYHLDALASSVVAHLGALSQ